MAGYRGSEVIPLTREQLWAFLDAHLDPATIVQIHPDIVAQRTLGQSGNETLLERQIRFFGKPRRSVWAVTYQRPDRARWEIRESEGPMATGSYLENTYRDAPGGTLIETVGDITVTKFPRFLQPRIVRSAIDGIGMQDLAYLRRGPAPPP
jgi:hypothetical protein